ncbi:MAG: pentapeptide repeat-containing protein [Opitutales bacterium]
MHAPDSSSLLEADSECLDVSFKAEDASRKAFSHQRFEACTFQHCQLAEAEFLNCAFVDCRFEHCDLSNAKVDGCRFNQVAFVDCKLIGISWFDIDKTLFAPSFERCQLDYSSFHGLPLKKVHILDCHAHEVSFHEADLSQADLSGTDFKRSTFLATDLRKADLRGAKDYSIDPQANKVQGARFSFPDVVGLLGAFGIKVEM